MSNSNGKITAPINVETDVYHVLGLGKPTCGYDIGYAILYGNINPWAKFKPTKYPTIDGGDVASLPPRWKGADGKCGLVFSVYQSQSAMLSAMFSTTDKSWDYSRPQGGDAEPYRLADFDGYNHYAQPNFTASVQTRYYPDVDGNIYFQLDIDSGGGEEDFIHLGDIELSATQLTSWYFGVAMKSKKDSTVKVVSSAMQFGATSGGEVVSESPEVTVGGFGSIASEEEWDIGFFLAQNAVGASEVANQYVILPLSLQTVTIAPLSSLHSLEVVNAMWSAANPTSKVDYSIRLTNNASSGYTFSSVWVYVYGGATESSMTQLAAKSLGNIAVAAGSSVAQSGSIAGLTKNGAWLYQLKLSATGCETATSEIEEDTSEEDEDF